MRKTVKTVAVILILTLLLTGCDLGLLGDAMEAANGTVQEKTFTNAGVTLTLTTSFLDFTETTNNSGEYPFLYANDTIGIIGVQENKDALFASFGEMDLEGYANLISELYGLNTTAQYKDGFWMLTYETDSDSVSQTFVCAFYETEADYWNIQGYCATSLYAENEGTIWQYITSATFSNS